jgi:hypothetical protein
MSLTCHNSPGPSFGHSFNNDVSEEIPVRCGPRHCGQSAAGTMQEEAPKRVAKRNAFGIVRSDILAFMAVFWIRSFEALRCEPLHFFTAVLIVNVNPAPANSKTPATAKEDVKLPPLWDVSICCRRLKTNPPTPQAVKRMP